MKWTHKPIGTSNKPRNPLVRHSLFRKAGQHGDNTRRQRDESRREIAAQLSEGRLRDT